MKLCRIFNATFTKNKLSFNEEKAVLLTVENYYITTETK